MTSTRRSRQVLRRFLLGSLTQMRQEFARRLKVQRQADPDLALPCATCAFRSSTDRDKGFEVTTLSFISALAASKGFFACHLPKRIGGRYFPRPDGEGFYKPCAAWTVLTAEPCVDIREMLGAELVDGLTTVYNASQSYVCHVPAWAGEAER